MKTSLLEAKKIANLGFYYPKRALGLKSELEKINILADIVYLEDLKIRVWGLDNAVRVPLAGLSVLNRDFNEALKLKERLNIHSLKQDEITAQAIYLVGIQAGLFARDSLSRKMIAILILTAVFIVLSGASKKWIVISMAIIGVIMGAISIKSQMTLSKEIKKALF